MAKLYCNPKSPALTTKAPSLMDRCSSSLGPSQWIHTRPRRSKARLVGKLCRPQPGRPEPKRTNTWKAYAFHASSVVPKTELIGPPRWPVAEWSAQKFKCNPQYPQTSASQTNLAIARLPPDGTRGIDRAFLLGVERFLGGRAESSHSSVLPRWALQAYTCFSFNCYHPFKGAPNFPPESRPFLFALHTNVRSHGSAPSGEKEATPNSSARRPWACLPFWIWKAFFTDSASKLWTESSTGFSS